MTLMISMFLLMILIYMSPIHPMKMTLMLTLFSLMLFINMGLISSTFMYSYMMFLIMIGGVIILILYFTSLIVYKPTFLLIKYMNYVYMVSFLMLSLIFYKWMILTPEMMEFTHQINLNFFNNFMIKMNKENFLMLNNLYYLYTSYMILITLFCVTVLLLILYFIAKISLNLSKPLRTFKSEIYE